MKTTNKHVFFMPIRLHILSALHVALVIWMTSGAQVMADVSQERGSILPATMLRSYLNECASCHIAYPPGMLPRQSWKNLMNSLNSHYGVDASLDTDSVKEIGVWLQDHSGTYKRIDLAPSEDRITESAWFVRKHRKIDQQVWMRPSIKSPTNCVACHTLAQQGDYRERNIVIPKN